MKASAIFVTGNLMVTVHHQGLLNSMKNFKTQTHERNTAHHKSV
jgi:hypothetical protein